jgi:hypothetical protein
LRRCLDFLLLGLVVRGHLRGIPRDLNVSLLLVRGFKDLEVRHRLPSFGLCRLILVVSLRKSWEQV